MSGREIRGAGALLLCVLAALLVAGAARHFLVPQRGLSDAAPSRGGARALGAGPALRTIHIPAGFRLEQVADLVGSAFGTSGGHFLALVDNPEEARAQGIAAPTLEGYLAPSVYQIPLGVSEEGLLAEMVGRFNSELTPAMRRRARQLGLSVEQVVTLASIVQREAEFASDMPAIAAVFLNRLRIGMPLQSSPTIQYAIDSTEGASDPSRYWTVRLSSGDSKIPSPYNTYLHKRLPPGPIDSPGLDAIKAVLYAPRVDYLYFVGKPNGASAFARTLAGHRRNVALYLGASGPAKPRSVLQGLLERVAGAIKGHVGIVVENLATGETASLNPDDFFTSASLYKLFVLDAAFERRRERKLSFDQGLPIPPAAAALDPPAVAARLGREPTVTQALLNMIVVSSNAAAVTLIAELGRPDVNRFVHRQGLRDTFLTQARFITTPRDVARLLELIAAGRAVGPKASRQMRTMLLRQELNGGLPRFLPRGTPVAHKTGELRHVSHDAGIVYTSRGPIIIVAMTEGEPDPGIATKTIARLAQFVVDYFQQYEPAAERIAARGNPACPDNPFRPRAAGSLSGRTIVLDPGHGGRDAGETPRLHGGGGLTEKALNLNLALRLKDLLRGRGATVYMTRCRDATLSLAERAAFANSVHPDVFLSIHANGSVNPSRDGTEVYYLARQGHMLANYLLGSFTLPALWQTLSAGLALPNGGAHQRELDVLVYAQPPGALTEPIYMTNPAEAAALRATGRTSRREQIAFGELRGILNYFTARRLPAPAAAKAHRRIARPQQEVVITATGDIVMGRAPRLPPKGGASLFSEVEPSLGGDVVLGNLEGVLSTGGRSKCVARKRHCFAFRVPPSYARWLKQAGFTVLNLANNHAYDFGARGRAETLAALRHAGLRDTGLPGEIALQRVGSIVVATVGFAPYPWAQSLLDLEAARRLVRQAAAEADLVIVMMHAGGEGNRYLHARPGLERYLGEPRGDPVAFAHAVVDAGADLVVGSGPHVLRGMEWYHGRLIAYSLGNLVGYRSLSLKGWQKVSAILRVTLRADGSWAGGRLTAVRLVKPGIPIPDPTGSAYGLVRTLSRQDFGPRALQVSPAGGLAPPIAKPPPLVQVRDFDIVASGDLLIHGPIYRYARELGHGRYDFRPMLAEIRPLISRAALAICHLETPLGAGPPSGYPRFDAPAALAEAIKWAGWEVCGTATNHSLDKGQGGIDATAAALDGAGVAHTGTFRSAAEARRILILPVRGLRIAFLDYTFGLNRGIALPHPWSVNLISPAKIVDDANRARALGADLVIANFHWGSEYRHVLTTQQRALASYLLRRRVVDLILGQHTHVVEPIRELYRRFVVFGEGNLLSNQTVRCCPPETQDGLIAVIHVHAVGRLATITGVDYVPIRVRHPGFVVEPVGLRLEQLNAERLGQGPAADALRNSYQRTVSFAGTGPAIHPLPPPERVPQRSGKR